MTKYTLQFPLEGEGGTITSVTLKRPKGGDMIAIGDHVATLARFYAANAAALGDGKDEIDVSKLSAPDAAVYGAMVKIAGRLTGLNERAEELDLVDLQEIAARALNPGEAEGRGVTRSGGEQ